MGELCANCLLKLALEQPTEPTAVVDEPGSASVEPIRIRYFGVYELLRQIGRGGMGVVVAPKLTGFRKVLDEEYDPLRKEMEEAGNSVSWKSRSGQKLSPAVDAVNRGRCQSQQVVRVDSRAQDDRRP